MCTLRVPLGPERKHIQKVQSNYCLETDDSENVIKDITSRIQKLDESKNGKDALQILTSQAHFHHLEDSRP